MLWEVFFLGRSDRLTTACKTSDSRYEKSCRHLSSNDKVFYKLREKKAQAFDKVTKFSFKGAMMCFAAKVTIKLVCLNVDKLVRCPFAR